MTGPKLLAVVAAVNVLAGCGGGGSSVTPAPAAVPRTATLYQRLGGYDALAAVTDEFLRRMLGDPAIAPYFDNTDDDGKKRVRQMVVDQLCAVTGGPCLYVGADMPTAHKDLRITEEDWNGGVAHLVQTLDHLRVPGTEAREVLEIVATLKGEIVGK